MPPLPRNARSLLTLGMAITPFALGALGQTSQPIKLAPLRNDPAPLVALGKVLFNDKTLSNPAGMACASCHDAATGYSYPISDVNASHGTVPGAIKARAGNRRPPTIAYAPYLPKGMPHFDVVANAWVGGLFWDGRAVDAETQTRFPFTNPNEMNNTDEHNAASLASVVRKIQQGPSGPLFRHVYGDKIFEKPISEVYALVAKAIVAYEASPEVSAFTSKYDAYLEGKAQFTSQELLGMRLVTGHVNGRPSGLPFKKSAHCMDCHAISDDLAKSRDLWTNACFANLGVPKNLGNLYYGLTDAKSNPAGFNAQGADYVDIGLAGVVYPYYGWKPRTLNGEDPLRIMSAFKAPTLRNVDKRPNPQFVKSYMHNGYFKSLKDVVHFYNSRNLTDVPGEVIDFTRPDPYAGLKGKPLWPRPEYLNPSSLINPTGKGAGPGSRVPTTSGPNKGKVMIDLDAMQIGNLLLSENQEAAIVAFLKTLSDGYFKR